MTLLPLPALTDDGPGGPSSGPPRWVPPCPPAGREGGIRWEMPPSLREHFAEQERRRRSAAPTPPVPSGAPLVPDDLGRRLGLDPPAAPPEGSGS